jgi:hypothetical protein
MKVVSPTPRGKSPRHPLGRSLDGPQSPTGRGDKEKKVSAPAGNRTPVVHPASQSLYWLSYLSSKTAVHVCIFKIGYVRHKEFWSRNISVKVHLKEEVREVKLKAKLNLCLTKHHAMKTCRGSAYISPCNLNPRTRSRWVISFTRRQITPAPPG